MWEARLLGAGGDFNSEVGIAGARFEAQKEGLAGRSAEI